jgi:hypothetical protein
LNQCRKSLHIFKPYEGFSLQRLAKMKHFIPIISLLTLTWILANNSVYGQSTDTLQVWTILPKEHLVPIFTADTRSHRIGLHKPLGESGIIGSMGGIFPLVKLNKWDKSAQFSAASTVYTTLETYTNRGYVVNVDYFVDFFLDVTLNAHFSLRGGMGHTSQHLADDALQAGLKPINFTRDYGQLFIVYNLPNQKGFCYGGGVLNSHFKTKIDFGTKTMFQLGFEHWPVKWLDHNYLYYAGDIKWRGELNYGTTQNVQIGYKYMQPLSHTLRLCLNYTSGYEERGQFYDQQRNLTTMSLYFDF